MGGNNVQIRGAVHVAEVDGVAHGLVIIDTAHQRIHEGTLFGACHFVLALADDATIEILVRVVASRFAHVALRAGAGGNAEVEFFEGPTSSADGSAVGALNRNRASAIVATTLVFEGPTLSADGTPLASGFVPGGTGGNSIGGSVDTFGEWVLDANDYLVRLTNRAGTAQPATLSLIWYEPPLVV